MKFFADTADTADIKDLAETGLLDGVTTNPSLIHKAGRDFLEVVREICGIVEGPVSAEVVALDVSINKILVPELTLDGGDGSDKSRIIRVEESEPPHEKEAGVE